jgi:U3 small nucleolar RNA-associated protein 21
MGELQLLHKRFKLEPELRGAAATCLTLTACGNFVLIGYSSGHVDRFNIHRYLRAGSFRKALVWQKRYLVVLLCGKAG